MVSILSDDTPLAAPRTDACDAAADTMHFPQNSKKRQFFIFFRAFRLSAYYRSRTRTHEAHRHSAFPPPAAERGFKGKSRVSPRFNEKLLKNHQL